MQWAPSQSDSKIELSQIIELAGFLLGLAYLYYEYHAGAKMWIFGLLMPMLSMWVYYSKGLYADCAMNVYYLLMAVYGYIAWTFNLKNRQRTVRPITSVPRSTLLWLIPIFLAIYAVLAAWLRFGTDSTVPYWDAFTTAMSIVGTWMLARKYLQQWIAWILVDAVSTGLYFYKGLYFYTILYAIYTVIAVLGYRKWQKMMR